MITSGGGRGGDVVTLVTCAGCGMPLGVDVPSPSATAHVRQCPKHPLAIEIRDLTARLARIEDALRAVRYRPARPDLVPECIGCGATGPIAERTRKRPAEPCKPGCTIAAALGAPP